MRAGRFWFGSVVFVGLIGVALTAVAAGMIFLPPTQFTVYDNQTPIPVNGRYPTTADLLQANNILLRPQDMVNPPLTEPPTEIITIQRAHAITVHSKSGVQTYWTQQTAVGPFLREIMPNLPVNVPVYINHTPIPISLWEKTQLPTELEVGRFQTVTIQNGGTQQILRTAASTVGEAVQEARIVLSNGDSTTPPPLTPLTNGLTIQVTHGLNITLLVDGRQQTLVTRQTSVPAVLAQAGITLNNLDIIQPDATAVLQNGSVIRVVRVRQEIRTQEQELPFQTVWQATDQLDLDTQAVIVPGQPGLLRQQIQVRWEDGVEVSQTPLTDWVTVQAPVSEVIGYGTRITVRQINTPQGLLPYWRVVKMRVTSYTPTSSGKEPGEVGYGVTASGYAATKGMVAVDRSIVPFRSFVFVQGYGIGYVGDTGGGVHGRWIDLGYGEDDFVPWSGYIDVYYLAPPPAPEDINYLLPTELP